MKISLRRALELAVGPTNVYPAGHAMADWLDGRNPHTTATAAYYATMIRQALRQSDKPAPDAVPHGRPDTSLRAELMAKLATQREVVLDLCDRVDRLEMRADGLTPIERVQRRWVKESAGGDKLDRLIAQDQEADEPAVPDDREPAAVAGEPSDEELLELMHQSMRDDLAEVSRLAALEAGTAAGVFRVTLNYDVVRFARAVLARWGHQPAPPVEGEVGELVAALRADAECIEAGSHDLCSITAEQLARAAELLQQRHPAPVPVAIPGEEYHEDMGPVTWWRLPVEEPPWVGTPNDSDWPGYHTHFTPAPITPSNATALPLPAGEGEE